MIYNEANFPELPRSWASLTVDASVDSAGNSNKKLKTKDALDHGRFPVIDQGQSDISGYSDDESLVVEASESNPVILFGDHTRILKQVSQSFVPGADGTKLFRAKSFWDTRFVYQMLRAIKLPDKGYARHFQYLRESVLPLPPLPEQKRIADKLDAVLARVDACRDRLNRIPAILKRFRQSVLAAATSGKLTEDWRELNRQPVAQASDEVLQRLNLRREKNPTNKKFKEPSACDLTHWNLDIPSTWSVESVSAYAECLDHLRIPVTRNKRSNTQGLYPYYGANGQVDMVDEYLFDDELVLVTEDETFYGREKPIAYRTSGRCWVNNHAHVLLAGDRSRADYLCYALMYYDVLPWLTGTTGRAKLTQGVLNSLPIAVPPQTELVEIVRRVEALFAYADRLEARHKAARAQVEKLTPATLAKAFRGELVPQDPNDEPASALLARIRAQCDNQVINKSKRMIKQVAQPKHSEEIL